MYVIISQYFIKAEMDLATLYTAPERPLLKYRRYLRFQSVIKKEDQWEIV